MKTKHIFAGIFACSGAALMAQSWSLTGDAGTVDGTNFIGTTDNVPFNIRVNNIKAGRLDMSMGNTYYGCYADYNGTTSWYNTGIGYGSLLNNSTGGSNTGTGAFALYANTSGVQNSGFGGDALYSNFTGIGNTAAGFYSLRHSNGSSNCAFGTISLYTDLSGTYNTGLGYFANVANNNLTNATAIGANAIVNANDKVVIGDNAAGMVIGGYANWSNLSDGRFKENIQENVPGLNFITRLRPVTYTINNKKLDEHLMQNLPDSLKALRSKSQHYDLAATKIQTGFIAQEVEKTAKELGYTFDGVNAPKNPTDNYSIAYSQFIMPLVKAVQEQQQMIGDMEAKLKAQQQEINDLRSQKGTTTGVSTIEPTSAFGLEQNIPNPFTYETRISYTLPADTKTAYLAVYDLTGKQLATFPIEKNNTSSITISAEKLAPGIYIYSVIANGNVLDSKRMIVAEK